MNELIARLEKAKRPDRELDADIARALGFEAMRGYPMGTDIDWVYSAPSNRNGRGLQKVPNFTESIDYALTLVPDGLRGSIAFGVHNGAILWESDPRKHMGEHRGATPAIALCIAALKARAVLTSAQPNSKT